METIIFWIAIVYAVAILINFLYYWVAIKLFYSSTDITLPAWKMAIFAAIFIGDKWKDRV